MVSESAKIKSCGTYGLLRGGVLRGRVIKFFYPIIIVKAVDAAAAEGSVIAMPSCPIIG